MRQRDYYYYYYYCYYYSTYKASDLSASVHCELTSGGGQKVAVMERHPDCAKMGARRRLRVFLP